MRDKTVIITGGSNGIGKAAALAFATEGAQVLITGRHEDALQDVSQSNPNIHYLVADSAETASAEKIVATAIRLWGGIDILVNNAGAGANAALDAISAQEISDIFAINVVATSTLTAACLPHLRASKGAIINISSTIGHMPAAGLSHYGASKAAVEYLTRSWALELAPDIRVNAVAPGPTESGALTGMMGLTEAQANQVKAQEATAIPLQRRGVPEDISRWILALADPASAWVTGQVIGVDGGLSIS